MLGKGYLKVQGIQREASGPRFVKGTWWYNTGKGYLLVQAYIRVPSVPK